jgi:hypothetical protein
MPGERLLKRPASSRSRLRKALQKCAIFSEPRASKLSMSTLQGATAVTRPAAATCPPRRDYRFRLAARRLRAVRRLYLLVLLRYPLLRASSEA